VEILIIALVVTGIAVIAGLVFGLRALALAKTHPEASSLNLIALNLLEPGATMAMLFVVFMATGGMHSSDEAIFILPVLAAIPLTWMLLAPLWTKAAHPIRGTIMVYGILRWLNTVAGWIIGGMALSQISSNELAMLAGGLIVLGTFLLCLSVTHLASSLSGFQIKSTLIQANS
jgi:hypothetical protein